MNATNITSTVNTMTVANAANTIVYSRHRPVSKSAGRSMSQKRKESV